MAAFAVEASDRVFTGRVFQLERDRVRFPDGRAQTLEIIRHPGASVIVPLLDDGRVVLIHQFRYAVQGEIWEVPAGTLEPGETPEACARRELAEEVGYRAAHVEPLLAFYPSPGILTEVMHVFLATGLTHVGQQLEADEVVTVRPVPLPEALRMIEAGEIRDAKTIIGLLTVAGQRGLAGRAGGAPAAGEGPVGAVRTLGVDHIAISVKDLARSERFYQDVLGMTPAFRTRPDHSFWRCGDQLISLMQGDPGGPEHRAQAGGVGVHHVALRVGPAALDQVVQALRAQQITIEKGPVVRPDEGSASIYFSDPDGNALELTAWVTQQ